MDIAKVALAAYLVISVAYIVVVYRRRVRNRSAGRPVRPDSNPFYTNRWVVAPTPLPEWAYGDEDQVGIGSDDAGSAPRILDSERPTGGDVPFRRPQHLR